MGLSQIPRISPELRRPLHKRRQAALTITPISYREWNKVHNCNCELVLVFEDEEEEEEEPYQESPTPTPTSSPTPSLTEDSHLVEIMNGLYIALVDDEDDVSALRTFDDQPFTHVVQVSYTTSPSGADPLAPTNWGREETSRSDFVQRLGLICPAVSLHLCDEQTAVGPRELHAAREFLSLALPHGSNKWWPEALRGEEQGVEREQTACVAKDVQVEDADEDADAQVVYLAPDHWLNTLLTEESDRVEQGEDVNALIVAPTSRAVDVLSVLFCYLSFLEDTSPDELMDTEFFDQVWNHVSLGWWSLCYVDLIARCN